MTTLKPHPTVPVFALMVFILLLYACWWRCPRLPLQYDPEPVTSRRIWLGVGYGHSCFLFCWTQDSSFFYKIFLCSQFLCCCISPYNCASSLQKMISLLNFSHVTFPHPLSLDLSVIQWFFFRRLLRSFLVCVRYKTVVTSHVSHLVSQSCIFSSISLNATVHGCFNGCFGGCPGRLGVFTMWVFRRWSGWVFWWVVWWVTRQVWLRFWDFLVKIAFLHPTLPSPHSFPVTLWCGTVNQLKQWEHKPFLTYPFQPGTLAPRIGKGDFSRQS